MGIPAKILVVEDEMVIGANISLELTNMGFEVTGIVPRGEEALHHIKQNPPIFTLKIHRKSHFKSPQKDLAWFDAWVHKLEESNGRKYERIIAETALGKTHVWGLEMGFSMDFQGLIW